MRVRKGYFPSSMIDLHFWLPSSSTRSVAMVMFTTHQSRDQADTVGHESLSCQIYPHMCVLLIQMKFNIWHSLVGRIDLVSINQGLSIWFLFRFLLLQLEILSRITGDYLNLYLVNQQSSVFLRGFPSFRCFQQQFIAKFRISMFLAFVPFSGPN